MAQRIRDFTVDPLQPDELAALQAPVVGGPQKGDRVGEIGRGDPTPAPTIAAPTPPPVPRPLPTPTTPANPYDSIVDGIVGGPDQLALRQSVQSLGDTSPAQAAEVRRLAIQYGAPPEVVQRNLAEYQLRDRRDLPVPDMLAQTPALARWASDPRNLRVVAKDDLVNLGFLSWVAEAPGRAFAQGVNQARYAWLRGMQQVRPLTQDERDLMNASKFHGELGGNLGDASQVNAPVETWFRGAITGSARQIPNTLGALASGVWAGLLGAGEAGLVGGAVGSVAGGVGALPGAVAGAGYGFAAGMGYGAWKFTTLLEAGNAADELEAFRDDQGRPLPPEVVRLASLATGSINGLLELVELKYIAQTIPGLRSLGREGIKRTVAEALHTPTVRTALVHMAKTYGEGMLAEPITEVAQKAVNIIVGEASKSFANFAGADQGKPGGPALPPERTPLTPEQETEFQRWAQRNGVTDVDAPDSHYDYRGYWQQTGGPAVRFGVDHFPDTFKQHGHPTFSVESQYSSGAGDGGTWDGDTFVPSPNGPGFAHLSPTQVGKDLWDEYTGAVQSFALMTLGGPALSLAFDLRRARLAKANQSLLVDLGKGIRASTTATTVPGTVLGLVGQAVNGTPYETAWIDRDVWKEYWQDQHVDPAEMFAHVSGDPTAYDLAAADGAVARLAVPLARYAEVLGGDQAHHKFFADELRLGDPDAWNGREQHAYELEQAAETAIESLQGQSLEDSDRRPAGTPVRARILGLLAGVQMDADQSEKVANLYEAAFSSLFGRAGLDPMEALAAYSLKVQREDRNGRPVRGRARADRQTAASAQTEGIGHGETEHTRGDAAPLAAGAVVRQHGGEHSGPDEGRLQQGTGDAGGVQARAIPLPDDPTERAAVLRAELVARFPDTGIDEQFVKQPVEHTTARLTTPIRRELVRILDELETHPFVPTTWSELEPGEGLTGNAAGGHMNRTAGMAGAPVYDDVLQLAPYNRNTRTKALAKAVHGERSDVEAAIRQLLLTGHATTNLMEGALRVAERREAGFVQQRFKTLGVTDPVLPHADQDFREPPAWMRDELSRAAAEQLGATGDTANLLDPAGFPLENDSDELAAGDEGDDSFDTRTLEQRDLFGDALGHLPPASDTLDTGEEQPRLPGAEAVRDQEQPTPQLEAPFSLTSEVDTTPKGTQRTLFQALKPRDGDGPSELEVAPAAIENGHPILSTRVPTAVKAPVQTEVLRTDLAAVLAAGDDLVTRMADAVGTYPQLSEAEQQLAPRERLEAFVTHLQDNLRFLWNAYTDPANAASLGAARRNRAKLWYYGAHRIAETLATRFHVTHAQASAVLAVLSPQKDWYQNVSLAERTMRLYTALEQVNPVFTPKLWAEHEARSWRTLDAGDPDTRRSRARRLRAILNADQALYQGQVWKNLPLEGQARLLRAFDERKTRDYHVIAPEGNRGDLVRTATGSPAAIGWGTFTSLGNAIAVLRDGRLENINSRVGGQHKVRSFFNNISAPWSAHSVTIDTHAVAAALFSAFGGDAAPVKRAMGGLGHALSGLSGTNALYAEAYFRLADELGVLPVEVQSVTWEAGRLLFRPDQKANAALTEATAQLWREVSAGRMSDGELHTRVVALYGGFRRPAWANAVERGADDEGGIRGRLAQAGGDRARLSAGRGDRSVDSRGADGTGATDVSGVRRGDRGPGRELFQAPVALTSDSVHAWAAGVQATMGDGDLRAFDVQLLASTGDLHLDSLVVARGATSQGLGSAAMRELTRYADEHGARVTLNLAHRGFDPIAGGAITTSRERLERFYRRFGFVPNRGRTVNYALSAAMYREPTLPTPGTRTLFQDPPTPPAPVWYSRLSRAVEDSKQSKAHGAQWKATIKNAKSGIDAGEWALAKVDDLVDGRSYTRQQVLDYLALNQVQVVEKTLREYRLNPTDVDARVAQLYEDRVDAALERMDDDPGDEPMGEPEARFNADQEQWEAFVDNQDVGMWYDTEAEALAAANDAYDRQWTEYHGDRRRRAAETVDEDGLRDLAMRALENEHGDATKYGTYVLPGGDPGSYREVFLTMPRPDPAFNPALVKTVEYQGRTILYYDEQRLSTFDEAEGRAPDFWTVVARQLWAGTPEAREGREGWTDGHGEYDDIKNPVVRLRLNTRTSTTGERVLFLEEVQPPQAGEFNRMPALAQKHWRALAFKWAIAQATAMGLDAVAWTSGTQQADRYSLEKHIGAVHYYPATHELVAFGKDARQSEVFRHSAFSPADIAEAIGQEAADKLLASPAPLQVVDHPESPRAGRFWLVDPGAPGLAIQRYATREAAEATIHRDRFALEGQDLRVGGAGLKQLYDVDFKRTVNALPAVKRLGLAAEFIELGPARQPNETSLKAIDDALDRAWKEVVDEAVSRVTGLRLRSVAEIDRDIAAAVAATRDQHDITHDEEYAYEQLRLERREATQAGDWQAAALTTARPTRGQAAAIEVLNQHRRAAVARDEQRFTAPGVRLTPELRASVAAGQPRFQDPPGQPEGHADKRGSIRFGPDQQVTISLFAKADKSTFLHETGHLFLQMFGDTADAMRALETRNPAQQGVLDDYQGILTWLGVGSRDELLVEHEERFARGFERYLFEGHAPSLPLQSTFARFRFWLMKVYQSISALHVELTPEVRGIMDRLLASDQAIAEAQARNGPTDLFTSAADAGMSETEFALYRETIAKASQTAREQIDQRLLREVTREQTQAWAEAREKLTEQVTADVDADPAQRAYAAITRGTQPDGSRFPGSEDHAPAPFPLSRPTIIARYGVPRLERLGAELTREVGGLDPDLVAEMFGFSSGDALLRALEDLPPRSQAIVEQVETRLHDEHGSLMDNTAALVDQAQAALANEDRERVIRAEVRALNGLRRTVAPFVRQHEEANRRGPARIAAGVPPQATLRSVAKQRIAAMRVRDIKPHLFWSASRRAAQTAIDEAARHDFGAAITAKTQELQQLHLYRVASSTLEEIDKRVAFAKGLDKPAAQQRLGLAGGGTSADGTPRLNILQQVQGILDRFSFVAQTGKALERRLAFKKFLEETERAGLPTDFPDELIDDARRTPYQELTTDAFLAVTDGLKALVNLARLKNKLLNAQDQRALDDVTSKLAASIRDEFAASGRTPPPAARRDRSGRPERQRGYREAWVDHRKMASLARELDGFKDGGPMLEAIMWPLNKAADTEATMNAAFAEQMHQLLERVYPHGALPDLSTLVHIPVIDRSFSRMSRIAIVLNWGNEDNRDRLRKREGWTDAHVDAIFATLTKADFDFAQGVLDIINGYWPEIAAKQERVYGVAPEKVDAVPISTPFGDYSGGYYPLKYDDREDPKVAGHVAFDDAKLAQAAAYAQATTKRNHTKERVENVKFPVRLDFGPIFEHVRQVIHDLSHHEALIDVARVLSSDAVSHAIYETHGDQVFKTFRAGIMDVAIGDAPATEWFERAINHVRAGASVAGLGWNVMTLLQQPLGVFNSMERIGVHWVAVGTREFLNSVATRDGRIDWILEASPLMKHRAGTMTREVSEIRNQVSIPGPIASKVDRAFGLVSGDRLRRQGVLDSFFAGIALTQSVADRITWLGAYAKAQSVAETHERSVQLADQAVLDSQGGGQVKDLAQVQRGGPLKKVWTNFYSVFNVIHNQLTEAHRQRGDLTSPTEMARLMSSYLLLAVLPASLGYVIKRGLRGDDDPWLLGLMKENAAYVAGTVMGVREFASALQGYSGYEGPAGSRFFSAAGRFAQQTVKAGEHLAEGKFDEEDAAKFLELLNQVTSMVGHYPGVQIERTVKGIAALAEGKTRNPLVVLTGPPRKAKAVNE